MTWTDIEPRAPEGSLLLQNVVEAIQRISSLPIMAKQRSSITPEQVPTVVSGHTVRRRIYSTAGRNIILDGTERSFPFEGLADVSLIIDAIYRGGRKGDVRDDPIAKLFRGAGNQGGFRPIGSRKQDGCRALVIVSSGEDPDWPDRIDAEAGEFIYYGDNKKPGHGLHETTRGGNALLAEMFGAVPTVLGRKGIPPTLVFTSAGTSRDLVFCGLAAPSSDLESGLVAIWRQTTGRRFQNYKARFDLLNCAEISRAWINALCDDDPVRAAELAPKVWTAWLERGEWKRLQSPRNKQHRSREEQLPAPSDKVGCQLIEALRRCFADAPHDFEFVAAELFKFIEPKVADLEITRKTADGGRDAVGRLRIGGERGESDSIYADFALEAKAYSESSSVGVREMSRLISRLRHRQFGVLVTTSYVHSQAYKEIREDGHPIVIIAATDIVQILRSRGLASPFAVKGWVEQVLASGSRED